MRDYEKLGVFYLGRECDAAGHVNDDAPVLYDSKDLTTHAVCVGMTGSGKTGLCLALLEEAALDGIPALCIDPKGDLANLLLAFPQLAPADFLPWMDAAAAQREGIQVDELAARTAASWKKGLADWGQPPERIARFKDSADVAIYTPGSESGLPLSVLRSFTAPPAAALEDTTALRDRIGALVSGLLGLAGRDIDPLKSRDHVLLANVLEHSWRRGVSLDMAGLVGAIQKPPLEKIGAFDLETYYPAKERLELAVAINNLLASPGFSAWLTGEPLDVQRLLFTPEGKPRIAILSIAHLSDAERMFIVTLVLNEMVAWMRTQSGTSSLRAIFYMDEIFGFFPPTANPPSKLPMLTLLKQARAYGLGCVLATQNPVDLDYKGLSNAGTWLIGRLQTERDKLRVLDGLDGALASSAGYDRTALAKMISELSPRTFLMRNVHDDEPVLFKSRWALSFLRGPMTGPEISRLMAARKSAGRAAAASASTQDAGESAISRPNLPADVAEYFLPAQPGAGAVTYKPHLSGLAKLHYVDAKLGIDQWRTLTCLAPLQDDEPLWEQSTEHEDLKSRFSRTPADGARYSALPAAALRAPSYAKWSKLLAAHLYQHARLNLFVCDALNMSSGGEESEGDFRARLALQAREQRDAAIDELKRKYATRFATFQERERRALERVEREKAQLSQQKVSTALSVGSSILGALLGRRKISATMVGKVATAARSAGRIGQEGDDVERANESLESLQQRQQELQQQFDADCAQLERTFDSMTTPLRRVQVGPRKSDIAIGEVALVWMPWRNGTDGFLAPAVEGR